MNSAGRSPSPVMTDVPYKGPGRSFHDNVARFAIQRFTNPGDVVMTLGAESDGVAECALHYGRMFEGFVAVEGAHEGVRTRIKGAWERAWRQGKFSRGGSSISVVDIAHGSLPEEMPANTTPSRVHPRVQEAMIRNCDGDPALHEATVIEAAEGAIGETPATNGSAPPAEDGNPAPETKGGETTAEAAKGDASSVAGGDEAPKKKVYCQVAVKIEPRTAAWTKTQIDAAVLEEVPMATQDRVLRETAGNRNELESYIYAMRDKLAGALRPYVEGEEADNFGKKLTAAKDWLCTDEGSDSTKSVYTAKLKELTDLGEPVEDRLCETSNRQDVAHELQKIIDGYIKFANSSDEAYVHVEAEEKSKVRDCAKKAQRWLFQKLDQQANFPPSQNPTVTCEEIRKKAFAVHTTCRPIMNTSKPVPKPAEPAKEEAKAAEPPAADGTAPPTGETKGGEAESSGKGDDVKSGEEGGAPKSSDGVDAEVSPAAAAGAEGGEPSKANPPAETPTAMDADELRQLRFVLF